MLETLAVSAIVLAAALYLAARVAARVRAARKPGCDACGCEAPRR